LRRHWIDLEFPRRSCIGILRLVKRYGAERVDAACARALVLGTRSYSSVAAILKNRREHASPAAAEAPLHSAKLRRGNGGIQLNPACS
jgi:hypothetical protein